MDQPGSRGGCWPPCWSICQGLWCQASQTWDKMSWVLFCFQRSPWWLIIIGRSKFSFQIIKDTSQNSQPCISKDEEITQRSDFQVTLRHPDDNGFDRQNICNYRFAWQCQVPEIHNGAPRPPEIIQNHWYQCLFSTRARLKRALGVARQLCRTLAAETAFTRILSIMRSSWLSSSPYFCLLSSLILPSKLEATRWSKYWWPAYLVLGPYCLESPLHVDLCWIKDIG